MLIVIFIKYYIQERCEHGIISAQAVSGCRQTQEYDPCASELCIAQPALSKTIHKLEEEFGAQLFIRNKKGSNVPVREKFCLNMQTEYWLFQKILRVLSVKVLAMQAK